MLPAPARLRSSADFRATTRSGSSAGRDTLVVHMRTVEPSQDPPEVARVGFVVSKAVGNAVTRNRVKRQLRHLCKPLLASTPSDIQVVVRALPAAADQRGKVAQDLNSAWSRCLRRLRTDR